MSDYLNPFYIDPEEARLDDWSDGDFPFEPHELELMSLDPYLAVIRAILEMKGDLEPHEKWDILKASGAFLACEGGEGVRNMWEIILALVFECVLGLKMMPVKGEKPALRRKYPDAQIRTFTLTYQNIPVGKETVYGVVSWENVLKSAPGSTRMIASILNDFSFMHPFVSLFDWFDLRSVPQNRGVERRAYEGAYRRGLTIQTDLRMVTLHAAAGHSDDATVTSLRNLWAMKDAWLTIKQKAGYAFETQDALRFSSDQALEEGN